MVYFYIIDSGRCIYYPLSQCFDYMFPYFLSQEKSIQRIPSSFLLLFSLESNTEEKMGGGRGGGGKDKDVEVLFGRIEDGED